MPPARWLDHTATTPTPVAPNYRSSPGLRKRRNNPRQKRLCRRLRMIIGISTGYGRSRVPDAPTPARYLPGLSAERLSSAVAAVGSIRTAHCVRSGPATACPLPRSDNCREIPVPEHSIGPMAVPVAGLPSSVTRRVHADRSRRPGPGRDLGEPHALIAASPPTSVAQTSRRSGLRSPRPACSADRPVPSTTAPGRTP
jgi:hypothetical protein